MKPDSADLGGPGHNCLARATGVSNLKQVTVSGTHDVATVVGSGTHWTVSYLPVSGNRRVPWFQAEGFVRDGDTVTYLVLTTPAQDYNYQPGHEPVALALQVAAHSLARSR